MQAELEDLSLQNNANNAQHISTLKTEINTILHHNELSWRQRSRSIWLPIDDKNKKISINGQVNYIRKIIYQVFRIRMVVGIHWMSKFPK